MNAVQEHYTLFSEIRKFVFGEKKNVSGIVYVPLTARLRAAYSAAYVAAYVVLPGKPTSRHVFRRRLTARLQKVAHPEPSYGFLLVCS